eukprot:Pgem_evm1s13796
MAPEVLQELKYTPQCDVWSFGITLWEIMNFAKKPYKQLKLWNLLPYLESGHTLSQNNCPSDIYDIMKQCWSLTAKHRPDFQVLTGCLLGQFERYQSMLDDDNDVSVPTVYTSVEVIYVYHGENGGKAYDDLEYDRVQFEWYQSILDDNNDASVPTVYTSVEVIDLYHGENGRNRFEWYQSMLDDDNDVSVPV